METADMKNRRVSTQSGAPEYGSASEQMKKTTLGDIMSKNLTPESSLVNRLMKLAIILGIIGVAVAAVEGWDRLAQLRVELKSIHWIYVMSSAAAVFAVINLAALVWRIILVWKYSPSKSCCDGELPSCSVIVPAYNEGELVLSTLRSLAASDYPAGKLQLIAVDDGSVDDTWDWMCKAKEELGERLTIIKQPENRGKRHALYAGFGMSNGEVLITVDSDSVVVADTLRNLVCPFAHDENIGAVAGNVRVLNQKKGPIPRMLDVIFVFSFDFIRASQSMVNTVMCTPGALAAYRAHVVDDVLEEWLAQTFCGRAANIGEDRAMTNLILREGYYVTFQQNAVVYTDVPTKYTTLCKMFLRWARSNIRETIVMTGFAFRRFRQGSMLGARINLLLSLLVLTKSQIFLFITFGMLIWRPVEVGLNLLIGTIIFSSLSALIYLYKYRSTDAIWAYGYGVFWFFSLSWITPYALLTPHRAGWLTRQINTDQGVNPANGARNWSALTLPLASLESRLSTFALQLRASSVRRSRAAIRQFFSL